MNYDTVTLTTDRLILGKGTSKDCIKIYEYDLLKCRGIAGEEILVKSEEPIDFIGETMVIYSLGNFLSSQIGIERLTGLMASVTIKKTVVDGVSTITLEDPAAELVYTKKPSYGVGYKLYPFSKLNDSIFPGYQSYYEKYMNIATNGSRPIRRIGY